LPRPIAKSHERKSGLLALGWGAPKFGVSLNISATDEASKFKSGTKLVFTKTHHKITPRGKGSMAWGYGISQNS